VVTHVSVSYKELNLTSNMVSQRALFVHAAKERKASPYLSVF